MFAALMVETPYSYSAVKFAWRQLRLTLHGAAEMLAVYASLLPPLADGASH
jgi:hypothetical protein